MIVKKGLFYVLSDKLGVILLPVMIFMKLVINCPGIVFFGKLGVTPEKEVVNQ